METLFLFYIKKTQNDFLFNKATLKKDISKT